MFLGSISLLLAGCGSGVDANQIVQTNVPSSAITGQINGGQNPIVGATISVYEMGTGGYGSVATLKASVTSDSNGGFSFPSGAYTCTQSNTPVYLLSTGGDTGSGANVNATLAVSLGTCSQGKSAPFVTMNEVTTVALAYALSHYFNTTIGGSSPANDSFGGPSTTSGGTTVYSRGLVLANSYMTTLLATTQAGYATQSSSGFTAEEQKVYTIANILAACVNSAGLTSPTDTSSACARLYLYTTPPSGTAPSDTLQAAVEMCLHPTQNVNNLYLIPNTKVAFGNNLPSTPADWSLAVSFTASGLGLGVDANTLSNIDIDANNRVWFPSTVAGGTGVAYFDPTTRAFSSAFNTTGMTHPEQLAIDNTGYAWVSDTQGSGASAYSTASPGTAVIFPLANTTSYAVAVAPDSSIRYGIYDSSLSKYRLATVPSISGSLTELTTPALTAGYIPTSLAFDNTGILEFAQYNSSLPRFFHSQLTSGGTYTANVDFGNDSNGQVVWNGANLIGIRAYNGVSGSAVDGYCVNASGTGTCYAVKGGTSYTGVSGMAVDGAKTLWTANQLKGSVAAAPVVSGSTYNQSVGGVQQVANYTYNHNSSNGNTLIAPEGVAIDNAGDVWVSNAGCITTGCTPGSFVLSVIVGAAAPTVTPVAAQIVGGASLAGTQPNY